MEEEKKRKRKKKLKPKRQLQKVRSMTANDIEYGNWERMAKEAELHPIAWAKKMMGI